MILEARNITKVFKGRPPVTAVDNVSFELSEGKILGLLGPNGAGKTTTIQILMSTLTPSSGDVLYFGKSLKAERAAALQNIGYASAYTYLPVLLTVRENLDVYGRIFGMSRNDRKESMLKLLRYFDAEKLLDKPVFSLSAGQKTRVMLAKAFLSRPKIVLLDEPTASLDPEIGHEVRSFVLSQRKEYGVSMLYTSHNMDEVSEVCDEVVFLSHGKVIAKDTPSNLAATLHGVALTITVTHGREFLLNYLNSKSISFTETGANFVIASDDMVVCSILPDLAAGGVRYNHITIERPSLEDYFLHVAKKLKKSSGGVS